MLFLNIVMSYIDYNMARLDEREVFSFRCVQTEEIYEKLKLNNQIRGAVLIATCNRTELYLSLENDAVIYPYEALCDAIGVEESKYSYMFRTLYGDEAFVHLCKVSAGAESQLWGDSQIITQVGNAVRSARKQKATDTFLNVMFRIAVSAGKKIKTNVNFSIHDDSTAQRAVDIVLKDKQIKRVLVIGNGMIGRLVAKELAQNDIDTCMTLRQYKHGEIVIPKGVSTVQYSDRYSKMEECDAVISATASPHFTLTLDEVSKLTRVPQLFIDMAVPRDVDPEIGKLEGVRSFNIDEISSDAKDKKQVEQIKQMNGFIEKYLKDFHHWKNFRDNMEKKVYLVSISSENKADIASSVRDAIMSSNVVVGHETGMVMLRSLTAGKTVRTMPLGHVEDKCRLALDYAVRGKKVALLCREADRTGYGIMQNIAQKRPDVEIIDIRERRYE